MSENTGLKYLQQLAKKLMAGKASEEEKLFLEEYYNAFEKHSGVYTDLSADELKQLQESIRQKIYDRTTDFELSPKPRFFITRWAAAAVILLMLTGTALLVLNTKKDTRTQAVVAPPAPVEVLPGGNKATLTLHNGATIILDEAQPGAVVKQEGMEITKTREGELIYAVAKKATVPGLVQYNTITTPKGGQYQVLLPDGTRAWLNAASSIHFPTSFNRRERLVSITGEVYFEVAHNSAQPFIVTAGTTHVQVLGTHFNVMAYDNEPVVKTTLAEGAVQITDDGRTAILKPNEQVQVNAKQFTLLKEVNVDAELAWKNGWFYFKDAGIESVMKQVERWYDISVRFEGKIPEKQFNGRVPRNVNLSELMEILSFYDDMKCVVEGNTVTIKR